MVFQFLKALVKFKRNLVLYSKMKHLEEVKTNGLRRKQQKGARTEYWGYVSNTLFYIFWPFDFIYNICTEAYLALFPKYRVKIPEDEEDEEEAKARKEEDELFNIDKPIYKFFGGLALAWIFFLVLFYFTEYDMIIVILMSVPFTIVLPIAMLRNESVCCLVLMGLPTLCTNRLRNFIVIYIIVLVTQGPAVNVYSNGYELVQSLSCQKGSVADSSFIQRNVDEQIERLNQTAMGYKQRLESYIDKAKVAFEGLKYAWTAIKYAKTLAEFTPWGMAKKLTMKALKCIYKGDGGFVEKSCNKTIDKVTDSCYAYIADWGVNWVYQQTVQILDTLGNWAWFTPYIWWAEAADSIFQCTETDPNNICVCFLLILRKICQIPKWICDQIGLLQSKITNFLSARVNQTKQRYGDKYNFTIDFNFTKDYQYEWLEGANETVKKVTQDYLDKHFYWSWFYSLLILQEVWAFGLTIWLVIITVWYHERFLRDDSYDNWYMTDQINEIEEKRLEKGNQATILPLTDVERRKYVYTWDVRMTPDEFQKLIASLTFFLIATSYVWLVFLVDNGMIWLNQKVGAVVTAMEDAPMPIKLKFNVSELTSKFGEFGGDYFNQVFQNFAGQTADFQNLYKETLKSCRPSFTPINWNDYEKIFYLMLFSFFTIFIEAYTLRTRHFTGETFYPKKQHSRAVWLYNDILSKRGQLLFKWHRKKGRPATQPKFSAIELMVRRFPILAVILKFCKLYKRKKQCQECARIVENETEMENDFKECPHPDCDALFCNDCFEDLNNQCSVCTKPFQSDVDINIKLEFDSSDEDEGTMKDELLWQKYEEEMRKKQEEQVESQKEVDLIKFN